MLVCRVIGSITATAKDARLVGLKLMLVRPAHVRPDGPGAGALVAVDTVGAGIGERVLVAIGSAARLAAKTDAVPTDAAIVAIVDPDGEYADPAEEAMEDQA